MPSFNVITTADPGDLDPPPPKRKRGRPRKNPLPPQLPPQSPQPPPLSPPPSPPPPSPSPTPTSTPAPEQTPIPRLNNLRRRVKIVNYHPNKAGHPLRLSFDSDEGEDIPGAVAIETSRMRNPRATLPRMKHAERLEPVTQGVSSRQDDIENLETKWSSWLFDLPNGSNAEVHLRGVSPQPDIDPDFDLRFELDFPVALLRDGQEEGVSVFDDLHWAIVYAKTEEGRDVDWRATEEDVRETARRYRERIERRHVPILF